MHEMLPARGSTMTEFLRHVTWAGAPSISKFAGCVSTTASVRELLHYENSISDPAPLAVREFETPGMASRVFRTGNSLTIARPCFSVKRVFVAEKVVAACGRH